MAESATAPPQPPEHAQPSLLSTAVPTGGVYRSNHFTEPEHAARHLQAIFTAELAVPPNEASTIFLTMADRPLIAFVLPPEQGGPAVAIEPVDSDRQLRLLADEIHRDHRGVLRQIGELVSVPVDHSPSTEQDDAYKTLINEIRSTVAEAKDRMRADADAYIAQTTSGEGAGTAPNSAPGTPPSAQQSRRNLGNDAETPAIQDFEALEGAFSGLARTLDPQISQDPRWKQLHKLWATMQDAAGKARQGVLRFRDDAQVHRWQTLWLRGCQALSVTSHQLMRRLERTRGRDSVSWNSMRLLHHQAEVSIAHIRGDLPPGKRAPIGTYDNVTTTAAPRRSETAASTSQTSPAAPAMPDPAAKSRAAARGVPGPLSWRMKPGGPMPQTAPAPPLPQQGPARDHSGTGR